MASEQQINKFISEIAPCAQNAYKTLGKVLPSICIGMACVECGYGTAGSVKHHSYLGQKVGTGKTATKYWGGKFFTSSTKEEYTVGQHTTIKAAFRAYDSMQQCVLNYYELLNTGLYSRVYADVDYVTQMQQIKLCGYMTSSTEVNSVIKIIRKYNLTQYDNIENPVQPVVQGYQVGKVYTLQSNMYVRQTPGGEKIKFDSFTQDAKRHGHFDNEGNGILNSGTRVTCKEVVNKDKQIWLRIPSGWVCAVGEKTYII